MNEYGWVEQFVASRWQPLLLFLAIAGATYGSSLANGFVMDDESQITENPTVQSLSMLGSYFTGSTMDSGGAGLGGVYYKPLMTTAYALTWAVFGGSGFAFHGLQLLLHVIVAALALRVFQMFVGGGLALTLALIVLVHPINTECVVYAADLQDTMYMAFGLAAVVTCGRDGPLTSWRAATVGLLLLLAMLSKETGFLFVLVCVAHATLFKKESLRGIVTAAGLASLTYLGMRFGLARLHTLDGDVARIARASLSTRLLTLPGIIWHYVATFVWPARLTTTQDWVVERPHLFAFWLPAAGALGLTAAAAWYGRTRRAPAFLFFSAWTVLGLGLHSQLIPLDGTVADRWFYFTEVGLLGMIGVVATELIRRVPEPTSRRALAVASVPFGLLLVALAVRAHVRSQDWRDGMTLYAHDLQLMPDAFDILNNYGVELMRADRAAEAETYFRRSTESAPHWFINWSNLGAAQEQLGRLDEARTSFERSIANGAYVLAYQGYARVLARLGRGAEARQFVLEQALPRFPANPMFLKLEQVIRAEAP